MKHVYTILLLLCASVGMGAQAVMDTPRIEEPKYLNSFSALNPKSGKFIELERTAVSFHAKVHALPGYASAKMTTQFKPGKSPVRLPSNAQFVVLGRAPIDPGSRYLLRVLKASKNNREFVLSSSHGYAVPGYVASSSTTSLSEGDIPILFEEYGEHSYRITPQQPLAPGEYALAVRGIPNEVFCFGVD